MGCWEGPLLGAMVKAWAIKHENTCLSLESSLKNYALKLIKMDGWWFMIFDK